MSFKAKSFVLTLGILAGVPFSAAYAVDVLYKPYVSRGHAGAELKAQYDFDAEDGDDAWDVETAVHYGLTDYWEMELAGEMEGDDEEDTEFSALALENTLALGTPGEYFIDPGLRLSYGHSLQGAADEIEAKLLLAKQIGKFSNTANIGFSREVGEDSGDGWGYSLAYGLTYDYSEDFQFGVEWYSDFGNFEDGFDEQGHKVGPVAYGEIGHGWEYEVGVLIGLSDSSPDATIKTALEFEF